MDGERDVAVDQNVAVVAAPRALLPSEDFVESRDDSLLIFGRHALGRFHCLDLESLGATNTMPCCQADPLNDPLSRAALHRYRGGPPKRPHTPGVIARPSQEQIRMLRSAFGRWNERACSSTHAARMIEPQVSSRACLQ